VRVVAALLATVALATAAVAASFSVPSFTLTGGCWLSAPTYSTFTTKVFDDCLTSFNSASWVEYMTDGWQGRWDANGELPSPYSASFGSPNYEAEYFSPSQDAFGTSGMVITEVPSSQFANFSIKSGVLTSVWKMPSNGGLIQISAKLPSMSAGAWPAFWWPPSASGGQEIDWFEGGFTSGSIPANHSWSITNNAGQQIIFDAGVDLTAAFHTYGFEYKPGVSLKVFLDGVLKESITTNVPTATDYVLVLANQFGNANSCAWRTCIGSPTPNGLQLKIAEVQVYH